MALNKAQREWAHRAYTLNGVVRCHFPVYSEARGWGICGSTNRIEVHHVICQGWFKRILRGNPDFPQNLMCVCRAHHVGDGYKGSLDHHNDFVPVLHPDLAWGLRNYGKSGKKSLQQVFDGRVKRTDNAQPYWNTDFDFLIEWAKVFVWKYIVTHPEDPFPEKRKK